MKIHLKDSSAFKRMIWSKGYSCREFSELLGVSYPHASNLMNGKKNPGPKTARKIADLFQLEFDEIFFINEISKRVQHNQKSGENYSYDKK